MTANEMMTAAIIHDKVDKPTGYPKLDLMQVDFKMNGIQRYQQDMLASITHFGSTVMLFLTGRQEFIKVVLPLNNIEFQNKYNLKSGNITLKVIHDPQ